MNKDLLYLHHIIQSIDCVTSYIEGISQDEFLADHMRYDAVLRNLQILAESIQKISPATKDKHPNIPWKNISGFRNILVHDYLKGIDPKIIWNTAHARLPELRKMILVILTSV
jgi:uncharacterized protein with HEPN domain